MPAALYSSHDGPARFADVILPLNLPQLLTYGIPDQLQGLLQPGMRVEVSLGRNKQYAAIVARLHHEQPEAWQVKPIKAIIDDTPIVTETQLRFWQWISRYYIAAPGEVMQAALPAHLKLSGETHLQWAPRHDDVVYEWSYAANIAVDALERKKEMSMRELQQLVGAKDLQSVVQELLEQEVVLINDALETAYRPRMERMVQLTETYANDEAALATLFDSLQRAPRQLDLLMAYVELNTKNGHVPQRDLIARSGATAAQIKALADKGIFRITEVNVDRLAYQNITAAQEIDFTPAQAKAYAELDTALQTKDVALLQGVTGSGKTLLYIKKIKECLAAGKQAILLLPEIALTTQLVRRLLAYFGEELGVYHSRFSNNERVEIWEKVRKGNHRIIVGPRSALWLPYTDIGLIIVDEEHDTSYKQKDPAPRFHARDASIYLASLYKAKVILGSATPSVESLYNVQQEKYGYVNLKERYLGVNMPAIEIVNAQSLDTMRQQHIKTLTPELVEAMQTALTQKRQVILFQNRRGYAPFQLCTVCGWIPHCKNCAVSLTYHKSTDKLHCHYCGLKSGVIHTCPSCGSNQLRSKTFGTERIEEEVQQLFPKARIARMDVDSIRGKQTLSHLLDQLEKQQIDILIGTQMVVKGLDFATVALVGILNADSLLSYPDFRVNERGFQLMEQVSGRAGRADGAGRVLIQAYNVSHPVLLWVQEHDIQSLYNHEVEQRQQFGYPPFVRIIKIIFKHRDELKTIDAGMQVAQALKSVEGIVVQGPVPAVVSRIRNLYVQEVWLKCPKDPKLLDNIKAYLRTLKETITTQKGNTNLQVLFDVDPV